MTELIAEKPLLLLAVLAILLAAAGWMSERDNPARAKTLRQFGYLGLIAALLLQVGMLAFTASRSDAKLLLGSRPAISVSGGETRIPIAADGHFWVTASVNGVEQDFLIDTGATFTGLSRPAARKAGVFPGSGMPQQMNTANGTMLVTMGVANELRFGSITVTNLPVAVPRDFDDDTNLLGMNFLSRLASWRVEGEVLVLVPKR
jgi:aspartyl protease family protein